MDGSAVIQSTVGVYHRATPMDSATGDNGTTGNDRSVRGPVVVDQQVEQDAGGIDDGDGCNVCPFCRDIHWQCHPRRTLAAVHRNGYVIIPANTGRE